MMMSCSLSAKMISIIYVGYAPYSSSPSSHQLSVAWRNKKKGNKRLVKLLLGLLLCMGVGNFSSFLIISNHIILKLRTIVDLNWN